MGGPPIAGRDWQRSGCPENRQTSLLSSHLHFPYHPECTPGFLKPLVKPQTKLYKEVRPIGRTEGGNRMKYYHPDIETLKRDALDALIDERVRYTVRYAAAHSPFYRKWFEKNHIGPHTIREHEDLLELPVISGTTIRSHQPPPVTDEFCFKSAPPGTTFILFMRPAGRPGRPRPSF